MKKALLSIIFFATTLLTFAQDVITTRTGEEIQSMILKVSDTEIEYKKWNNQDGPTFVMGVDKVFMIKYQNGEKQVFEDNKVEVEIVQVPPTVNEITRKNKAIYTNINIGFTTQNVKRGNSVNSWSGDRMFCSGLLLGVSWDADLYKGLGLEFGSVGLMFLNERFFVSNKYIQQRPYTYLWKFEAFDIYFSPVMLQYCYTFNKKDNAIYVTTGPTLDLALNHKYYLRTVDVDGCVYRENISYGCGKGELKHPLYVTWDVKLAFRFNMVKIQLGTSFGLNNVAWVPGEKVIVKRPFYLVVGINF